MKTSQVRKLLQSATAVCVALMVGSGECASAQPQIEMVYQQGVGYYRELEPLHPESQHHLYTEEDRKKEAARLQACYEVQEAHGRLIPLYYAALIQPVVTKNVAIAIRNRPQVTWSTLERKVVNASCLLELALYRVLRYGNAGQALSAFRSYEASPFITALFQHVNTSFANNGSPEFTTLATSQPFVALQNYLNGGANLNY